MEVATTGVTTPSPVTEQPEETELVIRKKLQGVSVIIPAYNEEGGIGGVLDDVMSALGQLDSGMPIEVIVVDDGSADETAELVAGRKEENLRLVRHSHNRGYGAALKTGIDAAMQNWVLITDADGTYPAEHIEEVLNQRGRNDMVVGARVGQRRAIPLIRRPPKWVLRKLASYLSQRDIPDLNSGFRVMRREEVRRFYNILPNGFSFTTTITLAMFSAGLRVKYVPINYEKREGNSHIKPIRDTIGFLKLIIRTILYFDPLRIFIPVSFGFFFLAVLVGLASWQYLGEFMDVTTLLLALTGTHMLALGMIADMMNRRLP